MNAKLTSAILALAAIGLAACGTAAGSGAAPLEGSGPGDNFVMENGSYGIQRAADTAPNTSDGSGNYLVP